MRAIHYAQALAATTEKDAKAFVDALVTSLKARGRLGMLPAILSAYARLADQKSKGVSAIVASEAGAKKHASDIIADASTLGIEHPTVIVDGTLVGGYIVRSKDSQIDKSYKRSLLKLYRDVTASA
jgi:F0F1-type ATP synthase delta subunit